MMLTHVFNWILPFALIFGIVLLLAELRWPLRKAVSSKLHRFGINMGVAGVSVIAIRLVFLPIVVWVSRLVAYNRLGLLNRLALPGPVNFFLAVLLLDYTFYWWHWMLHKIPILWRFHAVHHMDLDLDFSTAARFHFGEWLFSSGYRSFQILLIGADPLAVTIFEISMLVATPFHHSNIRFPLAIERRLNLFFVTPRMHGIHHSLREAETNSNFATILTVWDRLHWTLRLNIPQSDIVIGLPSYRNPRELTFLKLLVMPFRRLGNTLSFASEFGQSRDTLNAPRTEMAN